MKDKKVLGKLFRIIIAVLAVMIIACTEDPPVDPCVNGDCNDPLITSFEAEAFLDNPQQVYELEGSLNHYKRTSFEMIGESTNADFNEFTLRQSHFATFNAKDRIIHFEEGEFLFEGENGTSLFGTYTGKGIPENNAFTGELKLVITGGTGICNNAEGMITETFTTRFRVSGIPALDISLSGFYCEQ